MPLQERHRAAKDAKKTSCISMSDRRWKTGMAHSLPFRDLAGTPVLMGVCKHDDQVVESVRGIMSRSV